MTMRVRQRGRWTSRLTSQWYELIRNDETRAPPGVRGRLTLMMTERRRTLCLDRRTSQPLQSTQQEDSSQTEPVMSVCHLFAHK